MKTLAELLATDEPAWPLVREWIEGATNAVEVLPASAAAADAALVAAQVTVRSPMGAVIHETGGLLIDHGWLRVLGSGHPRLPRTAPGWTRSCGGSEVGFFLVADDALGGFFALDGGALGPGKGQAFYLAPDTCRWEPLKLGYSDLLRWCLQGDVARFYEDARWPGWEREVAALDGARGLSSWPPLWAKGPANGERSRRPVPLTELWGLHSEVYARQLRDVGDGTQVTIEFTG